MPVRRNAVRSSAVRSCGVCRGGEASPDGDRVRDFGRRRCIGVPGRDGVPATTGRFVFAADRLVVVRLGRGRLRFLIVGESDSRHPYSGGQRVELCERSRSHVCGGKTDAMRARRANDKNRDFVAQCLFVFFTSCVCSMRAYDKCTSYEMKQPDAQTPTAAIRLTRCKSRRAPLARDEPLAARSAPSAS